MGMGIVNDAEFEKELKDSSSVYERQSLEICQIPEVPNIERMNRGRGSNLEVPNSLRKIIGETSKVDGRKDALELAGKFGVSPSSVSAYANGSTSTASYNEQPNLDYINSRKEIISKKAIKKLGLALSHITSDKLDQAKLSEVSSVARDMSAIVKNMEPDKPKDSGDKINNGPTFVFYSPAPKKEESYDIVIAKDTF